MSFLRNFFTKESGIEWYKDGKLDDNQVKTYNMCLIGWIKEGKYNLAAESLQKDQCPDINCTDNNRHSLLWHAINYYIRTDGSPEFQNFIHSLCSQYNADPGDVNNPDSPRYLAKCYKVDYLLPQPTQKLSGHNIERLDEQKTRK